MPAAVGYRRTMSVTVKSIARAVGCSPATVSRVLTGAAPVRPEVRERVLAAVRETAYRPRQSQGPRPGQTEGLAPGVVEVILHQHRPVERLFLRAGNLRVDPPAEAQPETMLGEPLRLSEAFYRHIIDGVAQELGAWGWKASLQTNRNLLDRGLLDGIHRGDRRGVLLAGEYSPDLGRFVAACGQPLVLVDLLHDGWPDVVSIDNLAGVRAAVRHLVELGHRRLGFVGESANPSFRERWLGFCAAVGDAGLPLRHDWRIDVPNGIDAVAHAIVDLLGRDDRPTGIVCGNDFDAIGVLKAARSLSLRVPADLSVIGFDDVDAAALITPALTTIRVPGNEIGRRAVQHLLSQVARPRTIATRGSVLRVATQLIVRASTAAPAG